MNNYAVTMITSALACGRCGKIMPIGTLAWMNAAGVIVHPQCARLSEATAQATGTADPLAQQGRPIEGLDDETLRERVEGAAEYFEAHGIDVSSIIELLRRWQALVDEKAAK